MVQFKLTYSVTITVAQQRSDFDLLNNTPDLNLTGKQFGVHCDYLEDDKGIMFIIPTNSSQLSPCIHSMTI